MLHYDDPCTDPAFNLALEEILLKSCPPGERIFSLWQSKPAVLIGRFQNAWAQVRPEAVREKGIPVVRRITGGGAVYQDLGNVNFSMIRKGTGPGPDFRSMTRPVVGALRSLGVDAQFNSRNDITVNGCKVSGNAVHICGDALLHHGTLLLDTDFGAMEEVLCVSREKLTSKGISSVAGRVANLGSFLPEKLSMAKFKAKLTEFLLEKEADARPFVPSRSLLAAAEALAASKYRTWEWNYGQSPDYNLFFSKRLRCGHVEFYIRESDGKRIESIRIFGDFFGENELSGLEQALAGARFDPASVEERLRGTELGRYLPGVGINDLIGILFEMDAEGPA